jgi:hypothetical protein
MRILGILLCCLILGLSTVAFAEQPTTVFSKVVATKNMQGEIPEIDGLRYTNLQKFLILQRLHLVSFLHHIPLL